MKLTDFGIAKIIGEPSLTLNEQLFGTPGYIAPEYVGGIGIDGRSDIYSLAVVVYEMVTRRPPVRRQGSIRAAAQAAHVRADPAEPAHPGLPPDLESLLLRCLARDPADRPHDAFAMHDALQDIVRRYRRRLDRAAARGLGCDRPPSRAEPLETIIDRASARRPAGSETANVGRLVTHEMSSRWATALADLEHAHHEGAEARRRPAALAATRAAELALVAGEMVPRVERAAKVVGELQAKVDRLEAQGREFRTNLGHAIDVLVHDRSRERAHLDALRARRHALERAIAGRRSARAGLFGPSLNSQSGDGAAPADAAAQDPRAWEVEALVNEEKRAATVDMDLAFQLERAPASARREERGLRARADRTRRASSKASLSALRRLTSEIVRTIDDGIGILQTGRGEIGARATLPGRSRRSEQPAEAADLRARFHVGVADEAEVRDVDRGVREQRTDEAAGREEEAAEEEAHHGGPACPHPSHASAHLMEEAERERRGDERRTSSRGGRGRRAPRTPRSRSRGR